MENKKLIGHLAALLTIIIWGTTFISTKILLVDFKPVEILFFRSLFFFDFQPDLSRFTDMTCLFNIFFKRECRKY